MQEILKKACLYGMLFVQIFGLGLLSMASAASTEQYDYPELSVVPRSSDRLLTEAEQESGRKLGTFLPIQISSLATMAAGIASPDPVASWVGIGMGGAWMATSIFLLLTYHPYRSGEQNIVSLPKSSVREQLARERVAEEEIKSTAIIGDRMKWFSFVTHLGTSAFLLTRSNPGSSNPNPNPASSSLAPVVAGIAAVFSVTPLIFQFHWNDVLEEQREYKKRIYAPVASATLLSDLGTHSYVPGLSLSLAF